MNPENAFIYLALTECYDDPYFPEDTDFYAIALTPAEKDLILKALDYVTEYYDDLIYVGHMLPRLDDFILGLK